MYDAISQRRLYVRILTVFLVVCLFTYFAIDPVIDAHAIVMETALFWLFFGLSSLIGLSAMTYTVIEHQDQSTDFRLIKSGTHSRLVDHARGWKSGASDSLLRNADNFAAQIQSTADHHLEITAENSDEFQEVASSVRDYWYTAFSVDDSGWENAETWEFGVSGNQYDSSDPLVSGSFMLDTGTVNGLPFPTELGASVTASKYSGIYDSDAFYWDSTYRPTQGDNYLQSIFRYNWPSGDRNYGMCSVSLYETLGFDLHVDYEWPKSSGEALILVYADDELVQTHSIPVTNVNSAQIYSSNTLFFMHVNGEPVCRLRTYFHWTNSVGATSSKSVTTDIPSGYGVTDTAQWVYTTLDHGVPSRYIDGTGALQLGYADVTPSLVVTVNPNPDPEEPDPDDEDKKNIIWWPPLPEREESGEQIQEPDEIVWNDVVQFEQGKMLENGYAESHPDPQPSVNPDPQPSVVPDPEPAEPTFSPSIDVNWQVPADTGFESIWHYVTDTYDYCKDFFARLGDVFEAIPPPVMTLGWAVVVLVILFGLYRRFIE